MSLGIPMPNPSYFVAFEEHRDKSLIEFEELLRGLRRTPVGLIKLGELCSMADYPNGLYLFFSERGELSYVGKATSRSFIERVPSHFDQRHDAWFNTLPKRIMAIAKMGSYAEAHTLGLTHGLVLIGIKSKRTALRLEVVLRSFLQPTFNAGKKSLFEGSETLSEYEA